MFDWVLNKPSVDGRKTVKSTIKKVRRKIESTNRIHTLKIYLVKKPVVDPKTELEAHLSPQDVGISKSNMSNKYLIVKKFYPMC